jgi:hypothetical protein
MDRAPDMIASLQAAVSMMGGRQFAIKRHDVNPD